jgi:phosphohistidine phosphatase
MDMLLWRHADAEDSPPGGADSARRLTVKGVKQAARVAAWLDARVPVSARLIVSPAERARQTAAALSRPGTTSDRVGPGATPADVLEAVGWPKGGETVIVVGHQPTLGAAAALALTGHADAWRARKGAVWWLRSVDGEPPFVVAVIAPDLV